MKTLTAFFGLILSAMALPAQESPAPPTAIPAMPPGPAIILRAPSMSQWTITKTQINSTPDTAKRPDQPTNPAAAGVQTIVTNTRNVRRRQTLLPQGKSWDVWCVGDLQITLYPNGIAVANTRPNSRTGIPDSPFFVDYSATDFPEFWWVSKQYFAGVQDHGGQKCLYYKAHVSSNPLDKPTDLEAYVDFKTRLPVLFLGNGESHAYAFGPTPAAELELPDAVQKVLKARGISTVTQAVPQP